MRTKRLLALAICFLFVPFLMGLTLQSTSGQDPDKAKVAAQDKSKTAVPQKTAPPDRQKTKPIEMQKKGAKEATLSSYYKKWLDEDVTYIITPEEKDLFKARAMRAISAPSASMPPR